MRHIIWIYFLFAAEYSFSANPSFFAERPVGVMAPQGICSLLATTAATTCIVELAKQPKPYAPCTTAEAMQSSCNVAIGFGFSPAQTSFQGQSLYWTNTSASSNSIVAGVIGPSVAVLESLLVDGGYSTDSRIAEEQIDSVRSNIKKRIGDMAAVAPTQSADLAKIQKSISATLAAHSSSVAAQMPNVSGAVEKLQKLSRDLQRWAAKEGLKLADPLVESSVMYALQPQRQFEKLRLTVLPESLPSEGTGLGDATFALRESIYGNAPLEDIRVKHEYIKVQQTFNRKDLKLVGVDREVAAIYAAAKVRLAAKLISSGDTQSARMALLQAQSARYWALGQTKGVIDYVRGDFENGRIIFSADPFSIIGSVWSTEFLDKQSDLESSFGDWGLPTMKVVLGRTPVIPHARGGVTVKAPILPFGNTVDNNIKECLDRLRIESVLLDDSRVLTGQTISLEKFSWFKSKVNNWMDWDYKRENAKYDVAGNFNYGATGAALMIPLETLLRAAAVAGLATGALRDPGLGNPFGEWPYGNKKEAQREIENGYQYFYQNSERWRIYLMKGVPAP